MMISRPRSDIYINLPALQKLDAMLIVRLDSCVKKSSHSLKKQCFSQSLKYMNFVLGRKCLIVFKIQSSGMQNKGVFRRSQLVQHQHQDHLEGLVCSVMRKNGGCRFHVFIQVASPRSQGSI